MVVYAGQGDPRRTMELLWRGDSESAGTRPGPKPGLSVDLIVRTAIEIADAESLGQLSMRAVGERLGRTAMALYTYVPSKRELLDLMYDQAHGEFPPEIQVHDGDWRTAVLCWADHLWALYLRHPWLLAVSQARPVLGPHEQQVLECLVGILRHTRRDALELHYLRDLIGSIFTLVQGPARTAAEALQAAEQTDASDEQWWRRRYGLFEQIVPDFAERFPHSRALATDGSAPAASGTDGSAPAASETGGSAPVASGTDGSAPPASGTDAEGATAAREPYLVLQARKTFEVGLETFLNGVEMVIES